MSSEGNPHFPRQLVIGRAASSSEFQQVKDPVVVEIIILRCLNILLSEICQRNVNIGELKQMVCHHSANLY